MANVEYDKYVGLRITGIIKTKSYITFEVDGGLSPLKFEGMSMDGEAGLIDIKEANPPKPVQYPRYFNAQPIGSAYIALILHSKSSGSLVQKDGKFLPPSSSYNATWAKNANLKEISQEQFNNLLENIEMYVVRKEGFEDDTAYLHRSNGNTYKVTNQNEREQSNIPFSKLMENISSNNYVIVSPAQADATLPYKYRKNKALSGA